VSTTTLLLAILGTGISLAGLMIGLVAWLRADMRRMEDRARADMRHMEDRLRKEIELLHKEIEFLHKEIEFLHKEIQVLQKETSDLRERMAHLEGLLEGLREAIVARAVA